MNAIFGVVKSKKIFKQRRAQHQNFLEILNNSTSPVLDNGL